MLLVAVGVFVRVGVAVKVDVDVNVRVEVAVKVRVGVFVAGTGVKVRVGVVPGVTVPVGVPRQADKLLITVKGFQLSTTGGFALVIERTFKGV